MQFHLVIELSIVLTALILGGLIHRGISKRGSPVFESGRDRNRTIMMCFIFVSFFYTLALFQEQLSSEMVANTIGNITGIIGTAAAFIYKESTEGNGG